MASDEFLARIDQHMARGNELMDQVREHMARGNELMEQVRAEVEMTRISYEHQLQLTREVVLRNGTAFQQVGEVLLEVRDELRELKATTRAHTQAIFKLLGRLDGGAEPSGA